VTPLSLAIAFLFSLQPWSHSSLLQAKASAGSSLPSSSSWRDASPPPRLDRQRVPRPRNFVFCLDGVPFGHVDRSIVFALGFFFLLPSARDGSFESLDRTTAAAVKFRLGGPSGVFFPPFLQWNFYPRDHSPRLKEPLAQRGDRPRSTLNSFFSLSFAAGFFSEPCDRLRLALAFLRKLDFLGHLCRVEVAATLFPCADLSFPVRAFSFSDILGDATAPVFGSVESLHGLERFL